MTATVSQAPRMELQWPRALNKILTNRWTHLKNTLVLKDFVDHLIQKRVVTLDYWMGLKSKPITESERTEDFLSIVMKFNREKYSLFLEALLETGHLDLVKELALDADGKPKKIRTRVKGHSHSNTGERSGQPEKSRQPVGQTDAELGESNNFLMRNTDYIQVKSKAKLVVVMQEEDKDHDAASKGTETVSIKSRSSKEAIDYQNKITERLHNGIATIKPNPTKPEPENEETEQKDGSSKDETQIENQPLGKVKNPSPSETKKRENDVSRTRSPDSGVHDSLSISMNSSKITVDHRLGSAKSIEEILEEREQNIINRETELKRKEKELEEKDRSLQEMETSLIIRERSLVLDKQVNSGPSSLHKDIPILNLGRHLNSPAASSTQSSDYLAEVRDQIRELRRAKGEIEDETSYGPTPKPKEDYVKMCDLEIVQQDIADMKEGIATDRDGRETLQKRLEDQRENVETLNSKIATLENEKEESKKDFNQKITKLKTDLKNVKSSQKENLNKVKEEIKSKEEECQKLKIEMDNMKETAKELENRVSILETDRTWAEKELQRMEKEVANLKQKLDEKEGELTELRAILEETETERDELIDVVTDLKNEIGKLRADRKRLEQEKKTLIARCVKPGWNQNTRTSSFK